MTHPNPVTSDNVTPTVRFMQRRSAQPNKSSQGLDSNEFRMMCEVHAMLLFQCCLEAEKEALPDGTAQL